MLKSLIFKQEYMFKDLQSRNTLFVTKLFQIKSRWCSSGVTTSAEAQVQK